MIRIEESVGWLRVIVPGASRVSERLLWGSGGSFLGVCGAMALASVWAQIVAPLPGAAWSAILLMPAVWMFRKAARLGDIIWVFDLDKQALERAGRVVARFDELSSARCRALIGRSGAPLYELVVILHHKQSLRSMRLASTAQAFGSGSPADRAVFEQAAASIAQRLGARVEIR